MERNCLKNRKIEIDKISETQNLTSFGILRTFDNWLKLQFSIIKIRQNHHLECLRGVKLKFIKIEISTLYIQLTYSKMPNTQDSLILENCVRSEQNPFFPHFARSVDAYKEV